MEYLFGIFTTMVSVMAGIFKGHDSSRKQSDDSSADASGEGSVAVGKVDGNFTINPPPAIIPAERVNVPKETYDESLKNAVTAKALELQIAHGKEKALLQAELDALKNRQADPEKALQEEAEFKAKIKAELEREGNEAGAEKMAEAQNALENGDFSKAIEFFTEIKKREELGEKRSARASFALGQIAEQEIRWHDANKHFARAAKLDPCFETLIMAQKLALAVGDYPSALSLGKDAKKAASADYGEESNEYTASLNNLAVIYLEKGNYEKAEPILNEAIKIKKQVFGENSIETATSLNNIAIIYQKQKLYDKAEKNFKQVLEISIKVFGENDYKTADALNNLAGVYQVLGPYEKAEKLHNKALTIRRKTFKKNHPDIANSLYNLAIVYQRQGRHQESELLCKEALKIVETTLGPDHPHTKLVKGLYEDLQKDLPNAENDASQ